MSSPEPTTRLAFLRRPATHVAWSAVAVAVSAAVGGPAGAAGMALGLLATGFGAVVLVQIVRIVAGTQVRSESRLTGNILLVGGIVLKFPVIVGAMFLAHLLGPWSMGCFIAGLLLVYSALVGWALAGG
ncbi:MAG: hypothetical protein SNJ74_07090 [Fimbriimonadaceae bacterium]